MTDPTGSFAAGRAFVQREARLLERPLFATVFEGASPDGVLDVLRGYRNADGGFGHGLEPDKLCPASLPIEVEVAFQAMQAAGQVDRDMVEAACDWLASISQDGGVALAGPVIERYPQAEYWTDWTYEVGINPTAGLAGLLHALGVEHPWRAAATAYCWKTLEGGLPIEAHALLETVVFLEHVGDRERAGTTAARLRGHLPSVRLLKLDPDATGYGLTPLQYAPRPDSPWRALFDDDVIEAHLDRLAGAQQDDGGWPITWQPPSQASTQAWRGIETLRAVRVLVDYGRLQPLDVPPD